METEAHNGPGEEIRRRLDALGWTQGDLARVMDKTTAAVNEIIQGKRSITVESATLLAAALGQSAAYWLALDAAHRASAQVSLPVDVQRRRRAYELAPIREMERRGWMQLSKDVEETERELCRFFEIDSLDKEPVIGAATRKSDAGEPLTPSQRAWCFRVQQLAKSKLVAKYDESKLGKCAQQLRKLAAFSQEVSKAPRVLESHGIRFVIVEPLSGCKVDGVALWLDEASPVIGMSLRYDRIDSFWHTLFHEWIHIKHRHKSPLDSDLTDPMASVMTVKAKMERTANEEASAMLIPADELKSFMLRVGPFYSKARINQFAHRMKIHPGIIVGQLQHRKEIGYSAHRGMLVPKIREAVSEAATTDGWGHFIDPRTLQ